MALLFISKNPRLKENIDKSTHKPTIKQKYFNNVNFITRNNTYQDPF